MEVNKEVCERFPKPLKDKLLNEEIKFPSNTKFEYEPFRAYRAVKREKEDCRPVDLNDFKSHYELGKRPKKPRGIGALSSDSHYYGVSLFLSKEELDQAMKLPNLHTKTAVGYVFQEGGPQETNKKGHVCWWLFKNADVSKFKIIEE